MSRGGGPDPLRTALQKIRSARFPGSIGATLVVGRELGIAALLGLGVLCVTVMISRLVLGLSPSLWLLAPTPIALSLLYGYQLYALGDPDRCGEGSLYARGGLDGFGIHRVRGAWRLVEGLAELRGVDRQDLDHLLSDLATGRPLRNAEGRGFSDNVKVALVYAEVLALSAGQLRFAPEVEGALTFVQQASPAARDENKAAARPTPRARSG